MSKRLRVDRSFDTLSPVILILRNIFNNNSMSPKILFYSKMIRLRLKKKILQLDVLFEFRIIVNTYKKLLRTSSKIIRQI